MNQYNFSGNLGSDAELRTSQGGKQFLSFSVAVEVGFGQNKDTMWVKCFATVFDDRSRWLKIQQYLTTGKTVVVTGSPRLNTWTNRNNVQQTDLVVDVNDITLVGGQGPQAEPSQQQAPQQGGFGDFPDDPIPF